MSAPVFVVGPTACREDVPVLSEHLAAIVRDSPADVVICDVRGITAPTAATIDVLARLQLMARRLGCDLRLYGAPPRLRGLLVLTGLTEVLPLLPDPPPSGEADELVGRDLVGVGRQAEEREEAVDLEKVREPGDLAG